MAVFIYLFSVYYSMIYWYLLWEIADKVLFNSISILKQSGLKMLKIETHKQVIQVTLTRLTWLAIIDSEDAIEIYTPQRPYRIYVWSNSEKKLWLPKLQETIYHHLMSTNHCLRNDKLDSSMT